MPTIKLKISYSKFSASQWFSIAIHFVYHVTYFIKWWTKSYEFPPKSTPSCCYIIHCPLVCFIIFDLIGLIPCCRSDFSCHTVWVLLFHYSDVIMCTMASQISGVSIVYSTACSVADQRKHQSSAWLPFVRGIHRWPVNSPHKGPVLRKMFPFDDVIMWVLFLFSFLGMSYFVARKVKTTWLKHVPIYMHINLFTMQSELYQWPTLVAKWPAIRVTWLFILWAMAVYIQWMWATE